jgi:hypothetical protein
MKLRWAIVGTIVLLMSFAFTFITRDQEAEEERHRQPTPDVEEPTDAAAGFAGIRRRFELAKAGGQQVTQVQLDTATEPRAGAWAIVEVRDDAVVLQDQDGPWVVAFDDLQVFQVEEAAPSAPVP